MKKLLILLPILIVVAVAGVAFSKPDPVEKGPMQIQKRVWESFPRSGLRLGVVLSDEEPGSREAGVRVERVVPDSPAEEAGLKKGDVIVSMGGEKVSSPRDIRSVIKDMDNEPREIEIEIERDGSPMTLKVTPEKRDLMMVTMGGRPYLGVNLQELDSDLAEYFQASPNAGVLVTRVEPDSPAAKAGIRSGDVISHVDGVKVKDPSDVVEKLQESEDGDKVEITVLRHGQEKKFTVTPEQRGWAHPELPQIPEIRRMLRDDPEFQQNMQELRHEMENLKHEMQIRKEDLMRMKEEIQRNLRKEMDELKEELKQLKSET